MKDNIERSYDLRYKSYDPVISFEKQDERQFYKPDGTSTFDYQHLDDADIKSISELFSLGKMAYLNVQEYPHICPELTPQHFNSIAVAAAYSKIKMWEELDHAGIVPVDYGRGLLAAYYEHKMRQGLVLEDDSERLARCYLMAVFEAIDASIIEISTGGRGLIQAMEAMGYFSNFILFGSSAQIIGTRSLMAKANIERARNAANDRHDKPGGAREKQAKIRDIWSSGKYTSRDICAEQECAALGMSFSTARKALRNTPEPS